MLLNGKILRYKFTDIKGFDEEYMMTQYGFTRFLKAYVDTSTKINDMPLTGNIVITADYYGVYDNPALNKLLDLKFNKSDITHVSGNSKTKPISQYGFKAYLNANYVGVYDSTLTTKTKQHNEYKTSLTNISKVKIDLSSVYTIEQSDNLLVDDNTKPDVKINKAYELSSGKYESRCLAGRSLWIRLNEWKNTNKLFHTTLPISGETLNLYIADTEKDASGKTIFYSRTLTLNSDGTVLTGYNSGDQLWVN